MRVVLDTNILVSGIFFGGPPFRILEAWRDGKVRLAVTESILEEYGRVGERLGRQFPGIDVIPFMQLLAVSADLYPPARLRKPVCEHPDDDKFIACALASGSRIIVSGDKGLLIVSGYRGIQVLSPRAFVDQFLK